MPDFEVHTDTMREYADVVDGLHAQVDKIKDYMSTTACDTAGFTGLFYVLRPVVELVSGLYGDTLGFGQSRLSSLSQGIKSAADAYDHHQGQVVALLKELGGSLDSIKPPTAG